jgi:hypothetical protein
MRPSLDGLFYTYTMPVVFYRAYLMKVWLATVLVAPLLLCLYLQFIEDNWSGFTEFFALLWLMIMFSAACSAPTFLLLILLFTVLRKILNRTLIIKAVTILVGLSGVFISFYIIQFNLYPIAPSIIYALVLLCAVLLFQLRQEGDY